MLSENAKVKYHIGCSAGDVGRYCIMPGDPERCEKIAEHFENAKLVSNRRGYVTYTGYLCGERVSAVSSGIGGPSAAIVIEELSQLGVHTIIRTGTCGGISEDVHAGDIVIATSSIRCDGTTREYVPIEFPAAASFEAICALVGAAESLHVNHHVGTVHSKDSFYGQTMPETMPIEQDLLNKWNAWKKMGTLASEMESSTLFIVGAARGLRCGACFSVVWNQELEKAGRANDECFDTDRAVLVSVEAVKRLIHADKSAKEKKTH